MERGNREVERKSEENRVRVQWGREGGGPGTNKKDRKRGRGTRTKIN